MANRTNWYIVRWAILFSTFEWSTSFDIEFPLYDDLADDDDREFGKKYEIDDVIMIWSALAVLIAWQKWCLKWNTDRML